MSVERLDTEVIHRDGYWYVQIRPRFKTQAAAWDAANQVARKLGSESYLRGLLGRWRERNTFPRSRDPKNSKG